MSLRFFLNQDAIAMGHCGLHIRKGHADIGFEFATEIVFKKIEEPGIMTPPALFIKPDEAQQLMDELWRIGFRPSEGTGSAGALAATQNHLDDMRRLVFKLKRGPDA